MAEVEKKLTVKRWWEQKQKENQEMLTAHKIFSDDVELITTIETPEGTTKVEKITKEKPKPKKGTKKMDQSIESIKAAVEILKHVDLLQISDVEKNSVKDVAINTILRANIPRLDDDTFELMTVKMWVQINKGVDLSTGDLIRLGKKASGIYQDVNEEENPLRLIESIHGGGLISVMAYNVNDFDLIDTAYGELFLNEKGSVE